MMPPVMNRLQEHQVPWSNMTENEFQIKILNYPPNCYHNLSDGGNKSY